MRHEIILSPQATQDLRRLDAFERATIRDALEAHLRHEPTKLSKSRIKRLRGLAHPQYRLRVGDYRAFYDVVGEEVHVLAIVAKADAESWLEEAGKPDEEAREHNEEGGALGSEG
jgi:mRNA-degrading endonuclease RelE of RelBE toxin-antitoxin system